MTGMTWDQLRQLQRRLAGWTERWECEQHEVYTVVEEAGRLRRVHLAWVQSQELASLVCDMHNNMALLLNALVMYGKMAQDKQQEKGGGK